jgi:hypothetical protein
MIDEINHSLLLFMSDSCIDCQLATAHCRLCLGNSRKKPRSFAIAGIIHRFYLAFKSVLMKNLFRILLLVSFFYFYLLLLADSSNDNATNTPAGTALTAGASTPPSLVKNK